MRLCRYAWHPKWLASTKTAMQVTWRIHLPCRQSGEDEAMKVNDIGKSDQAWQAQSFCWIIAASRWIEVAHWDFFWAKTKRMGQLGQLVQFDGIIVYPCASFEDGTITDHRLVWVIAEARCKDGCRLSDGAGVSFGKCRDPFYFPYNLQQDIG